MNYLPQRDIVATESNGTGTAPISGSTEFLDHGQVLMNATKPRTRKPWVYKSEFDLLERKYKRLSIYSVIISMLFILALIASFN